MTGLSLPNTTTPDAMSGVVVRILNKDKPYAEVHGLPGVRYEQDGVKFKSDFTEALPEDISPYIEEIPDATDESPHPINAITEQQTPPADMATGSGETIDTMNTKSIKLLLASYGEEWPGSKQAAIAILKGINTGS